jgi:CBS domain-containing protein
MRVAEVMTRGIELVDGSATVQEAATKMADLDLGAIFVGSEEAVEGVLTDRDIILRVVVDGRNPVDVKVSEVMSPELFWCKEDDTVESAIAEMRERQIRRMPVLSGEDKPVGVVTLSDIAKTFEGPEQIEEKLREISEPHRKKAREPAEEEPPTKEEKDSTAADPSPDKVA